MSEFEKKSRSSKEARPPKVERLASDEAVEKLVQPDVAGHEGAEMTDEQRESRLKQLKETAAQESLAERGQLEMSPSQKVITDYVEKNLPPVFQQETTLHKVHNVISRLAGEFWRRLGRVKIEGREHVPPTGPLLVVANHSRHGDEMRVRASLGRAVYVTAADLHFDSAWKRWLLERMGFIEVEASLANLSEDEKERVIQHAPSQWDRDYYVRVRERDKRPNMVAQRQLLRRVVALLAKGEAVAVFPEGLWHFDEAGKSVKPLRQAYAGVELIAKEFHRLTGRELPIQPMAVSDERIALLEPLHLERNQTVHDVMKVIAQSLPEEERGYYRE